MSAETPLNELCPSIFPVWQSDFPQLTQYEQMMSALGLGNQIFFASSMNANAIGLLLMHEDAFLTQQMNGM
jgi:hypothetical protein